MRALLLLALTLVLVLVLMLVLGFVLVLVLVLLPVLLVPVVCRFFGSFLCGRHVSQRRDSFPTASLTTIPLGQS